MNSYKKYSCIFYVPLTPWGCALYAAQSTYAVTGNVGLSLRSDVFAFAGSQVFPSKGEFTWKTAVVAGASAENKGAGQALALIFSGKIRSPQEVLYQATNYYTQKEVGKIAAKNGLSLYEFNVLLGINSRVGNELIGDRYNEETGHFSGILTRSSNIPGRLAGFIWDVNDIVLGYQGLVDASGFEYINDPNRSANITGHSLGALTANNLVGNGFADSAQVYSLPFGNSAAANVNADIGNIDLVNGFVFGRVLNPFERSTISPSYWNVLKNYNCGVSYAPGRC